MVERRGTKALELWCKRLTEGYENVKIDNMTTSWKNGLAFCAMVHHFRPDLIDFDKLNKNDIYYNNDLAFRTAEQYLGIPALLDADDMASYEVPDRLSILTYLSQFYQTFGAQDSPNRLKRNSTSTVETTVSKSAGPPTKMAHIVGVPKREPCLKCSLPVFLAERQIIGKSVYHRTCLKCARCKTQLTPGSFYETEIDGEFCCETCPDEEQTQTLDCKTENYHTSNLSITLSNTNESKNIRSSIADRLAFFEMNCSGDGKRLLQKSLSDEEKSQSLKKITEFKPNTALLAFLNDSVDEPEYIQNAESEYNPTILPTIPSVSLYQEHEENLLNSSPDENKSDIIKGTIDTRTSDAVDSSTILPLNETQITNKYSNNNFPNVSVNVTKENNSNIKDSVHMITPDELFNQISDSDTPNSTKSLNLEKTIDDLQQQNMIREQQFDETSTSESEINPSLNKNTSDNNNKSLSFNKSKEINDIINNLNDRSKEIFDSNDILISKENEEVPKCETEDEDSFKVIDELSNKNTINLQENIIPQLSTVNIKFSPVEQFANTETVVISKPTEAIDENYLEDKHEEIKLLEDDQELLINTNCKLTDEIENQKSISNISSISSEEAIKDEIAIERKLVDNMEPNQYSEDDSILLRRLSNEYPDELNPFQSDENEDVQSVTKEKIKSLNPFGSDEDDDNDAHEELSSDKKLKPPRPPPPKVSKNPFGSASDSDEENEHLDIAIVNSLGRNSTKKVPIPTPRTQISPVKKETSEPELDNYLNNCEDYYGSSASLNAANNSGHREIFHRHHEISGSNNSLTSSTAGRSSRKSKKAPAPPPPTSQLQNISRELFVPDHNDSIKSSPNSSASTTPQQLRKKRPAPKPPVLPRTQIIDENDLNPVASAPTTDISEITNTSSKLEQSPPEIGKLSDEEKAAHLNEKTFFHSNDISESESENNDEEILKIPLKRLITLDKSLLEDSNVRSDVHLKEEHNVVYRRSILPPLDITTPTKHHADSDLIVSFPISSESPTHDRQLEKMKDNKESKNRNRQSQCSDDLDPLLNKSTHGKWKRRKGPAPSLPVPPRKILQMLPLQEIRHELEIIEVQQQGLEKQGVILETMIRERCESKDGKLNDLSIHSNITDLPPVQNSKEVEDLILQLFELVNEKNELFRRQAELMYLRRQHRLEQEQADLEYEIRVLMAQPERNKTDTDKAREEALIARLVEVVQLRNEVIECLEMDRLREAEEDLSIKQRLELHTAKRDEQLNKQTPTKLSKKEKKKQKETKKLGKSKKLDADKDADESEVNVETQKDKKKKKKFLF